MNRNLKILHENGISIPRSKWKVVRNMAPEEILEFISTIEKLRILEEV